MSDSRYTPYTAFNFIVSLSGTSGTQPMGGFSDVSGLSTEITEAEYRAGNYPENHVAKIPGIYKTGDITLKRGLMRTTDAYDWMETIRTAGITGKNAQRPSVVITLLDEARAEVAQWTLLAVLLKKLTGPTLAAKGGADVAMEEVILSAEKIEFKLI